jgi:HK97 gp10 family phage protein
VRFVAEVVGAEDLQETLQSITTKEAKNLLRRVTYAVSKDVCALVKVGAPHDTETLVNNITYKRERGTPGSIEASVTITKPASRYYHFAEFGTMHQSAHPYIIPAVEQFRAKLDEIFRKDFFEQLAKTLAKRNKAARK